jgi:hypothetical protein
MNPPLFIFQLSAAAAGYNAKVLAEHGFDLDRIIANQHPSQISYGSKFHDPALLEELICYHPFWSHLQSILSEGVSFPLNYISPEDREQDLIFHANRGNHKSAIKNIEALRSIIKEDVEWGFALPLPIMALHFLPNASLAPLGCVKQSLVDVGGNCVVEFRMTHDQTSNLSVNLRVQHDKLPPIRYSFVLMQMIHYILDLRNRHPTTKIYLCKFDIDATYRWCTLSSSTAFESVTMFEDFLLIALQMTFGGSTNPALWGVISETTTDICNSLLSNNYWDHTSTFDTISDTLGSPMSLSDDIPFHQAKELAVSLLVNDLAKVDIFIDDTIGAAPDLGDVPTRVSRAIPLAIQTLRDQPKTKIISQERILSH